MQLYTKIYYVYTVHNSEYNSSCSDFKLCFLCHCLRRISEKALYF